jgi:hypothetical protein
MSQYEKEINIIENKYGNVMFRMGIAHMVDVGARHLTDENVTETIRQITINDEKAKADGSIPVMTVEFQSEIVRCAAELAKFSVWELIAYIKEHIVIEN